MPQKSTRPPRPAASHIWRRTQRPTTVEAFCPGCGTPVIGARGGDGVYFRAVSNGDRTPHDVFACSRSRSRSAEAQSILDMILAERNR